MILSDYHVHSEFSSDSESPMESMVKRAIELNFNRLCFTDHMDYNYPTNTSGMNFLFEPELYQKKINLLKEKYEGHLQILTGIELGLQAGIQENIQSLLKTSSFDFIIGSTHLVDKMDPYYDEYWNQLYEVCESKESAIRHGIEKYFITTLEQVKTYNDFSVYGHLDYIVRYAPGKDKYYDCKRYLDLLDEILRRLIQTGKGIELNTSGYKAGLSFPNPHHHILKRYRELGGEILTIGSDAHVPEHLGYEFARARELLIHLGYQYYTVFEHRDPIFIKL